VGIINKLTCKMIFLFNFYKLMSRTKDKFLSLIIRFLYGFKSIGKNFDVAFPFIVTFPNNITIGDNFISMQNLYLYADQGEVVIGNNVAINTNVVIGGSGSKIIIGNNVLIGPNVVIRAANHSYKNKNKLINKQGHIAQPITIEDDVWICSNVVITSGVTIKKGSVIGAGSVVTKNVDEYSVIAGIPSKLIGKRY